MKRKITILLTIIIGTLIIASGFGLFFGMKNDKASYRLIKENNDVTELYLDHSIFDADDICYTLSEATILSRSSSTQIKFDSLKLSTNNSSFKVHEFYFFASFDDSVQHSGTRFHIIGPNDNNYYVAPAIGKTSIYFQLTFDKVKEWDSFSLSYIKPNEEDIVSYDILDCRLLVVGKKL